MQQQANARRTLRRLKPKAERVVENRGRALKLADSAYQKFRKEKGSLRKLAGSLPVLIRLLRSWAKREYRTVPWRTVVLIAAGILYFVNPFDLVPDVLTGIGFVDDLSVLTAVLAAVQGEVEKFEAWEAERGGSEAPPA
ncbi:MAG: YkvA family protein [Bacteroidota bacterium]